MQRSLLSLGVLTLTFLTLSAQAPSVDNLPTDINYETYGQGMTPLTAWLNNNGGAVVTPAPGCEPAEWSNDFDMANFDTECGFYSGTIDVTFTYTDACGNTLSYTRNATLFDDTPPTCVKPSDLTIDCSDPDFEETVAAYAAYWGPVTDLNHPITVTSSYDEDGFDENGQQTIVWTFTDACGNSRTWEAVLNVTGDCECIVSAGTLTIDESPVELENGSATISATPNGDVILDDGYEIIYVLTEGTGLVIQAVSATPSFEVTAAGSYTIHTLVYDPSTLDLGIVVFGTTTGFDVFGLTEEGGGLICASLDAAGAPVTVTDPPILVVDPPPNFDLDCTETIPEGGVVATTTCPDGIINVVESEEVIPMGCPGSFTLIRTYEVSDNCGNSETVSQTITVTDTTPPVFSFVPESADVGCQAYPDGFGTPGVGDACGDFELTFEDFLAPYICDADFDITRVWTATDECGNVSTASQTLTIWPDLEPPVFTFVPANEIITCPEVPVFGEPVVEDACTEFTVTSEVVTTGSCPDGYTATITWTAVDGCGNASSQSQTITVEPQPIPITLSFSSVPEAKTVECGATYAFDTPQCASNCDAGYSLTHEDFAEEGSCAGHEVLTRRWTASDACGNTAVCQQVINIVDETAPEFTAIPSDKTVFCGDELLFSEPATADLCGGVTLSFTDEDLGANDEFAQIVSRTWEASDACGNTSYFENTISVIDNEKPTFNIESTTLTLSAAAYAQWTAPPVIAYDECSNVTLDPMTVFQASDSKFIHAWRAIDDFGNKRSVTITVTVLTPWGGQTGLSLTGLALSPNPTTQNLIVNISLENPIDTDLEVVDMRGQVQVTQALELYKGLNNVTLDLGNLVTGTYFVRMKTQDGLKVKRFVKL